MKPVYIETSALLRWLFNEPQANDVEMHLKAANPALTSVITAIEAKRAIHQHEARGMLSTSNAHKLTAILKQVATNWTIMDLTEDVQEKASQRFPIEPVRSLDAIHLATALTFLESFPDLEVLTFDERIIANIEPLGLSRLQ